LVAPTAIHDREHVDIVVGYHHVLLLGLLFGVLMFGSGYFVGSYDTPIDPTAGTTSAAISSTYDLRAAEPPAVPAPSTGREASGAGEAAQEGPTLDAGTSAAATSGSAAPSSPPPLNPQSATAMAAAAGAPGSEHAQTPAPANQSQPEIQPRTVPMAANPTPGSDAAEAAEHYFWDDSYQRYRNPQTRDPFKVYLRISSFRAKPEAEALIDDLTAQGIGAVIEGQSVEGRHMVLIGPFADYRSAASLANALKQQRNLDTFPIRR
jgi:hypothetical protein